MRTDWVAHLGGFVGKAHYTLAASAGEATTALLRSVLGVKREVIVPNIGCHSVAAAVVRAGGIPVFVEVGESLILTADDVQRALSPSTRAVIAIDQYGIPADYAAIRRTLPRSVMLIADLAQSWDARLRGVPSGADADAVVRSFGPRKPITLGGGGAVFADEPVSGLERGDISDRFASHVQSAAKFPLPLLDKLPAAIQAANIGVKHRRQCVDYVRTRLEGMPVQITPVPPGSEPSWTRVPLIVPPDFDVRSIAGLGVTEPPHESVVSKLPMFRSTGYRTISRPARPNFHSLLLRIPPKEPHGDSN